MNFGRAIRRRKGKELREEIQKEEKISNKVLKRLCMIKWGKVTEKLKLRMLLGEFSKDAPKVLRLKEESRIVSPYDKGGKR